ncbi:beta-galactosidase [Oceanispirochaeta sp.]|jgi:beta-galactosidase|uniref:beta-galactosidase n=1 Tax=Oceanispirochaeta sp. TaxID=2035350 RepID=UPI00261394C2|nr:beta-galactosidase [Oceanispirochaeta sp.]MDA3958902.1 beta-galactosidase [Oceanispirochaeta sp.]
MKETRRQGLCYGGDYNPEQWPEEIWEDDIRLMKLAGVNFVSLGIFSWALLQPSPDHFDFSFLDKIMDMLAAADIGVDMATPTAAQPPWLSHKYPDILPVSIEGMRYSYGSRQCYCPNSSHWKEAASFIARKVVDRYKDHPALVMWHINNEYTCHVQSCYCDNCADAFRSWLKERYASVEGVNKAWGTRFWSQYYYQWDEILPPRRTTAQPNPGHVLDYRRFMNDSVLDLYLMEKKIIEELSPDVEVMTNFMMTWKDLNLFQWAGEVDIVTWNSYPDPDPGYDPSWTALDHDIMRSLKQGQPFMVMEQAPSQVNWRDVNRAKAPGMMKLYSYQAMAHGADGLMFFQWRQSRRGSEKFHSACVTHTGDEHSRVFREVVNLGSEMKLLAGLKDAEYPAETAILLDYENWWALEYENNQSSHVKYLENLRYFYKYFYDNHIPVDFVHPSGNLDKYRMIVAPFLYMLQDDAGSQFSKYVEQGGHLVVSCGSGLVDSQEAVFEGGYPGPLKDVLGIRVEEFDPLYPGQRVSFSFSGKEGLPDAGGDLWQDRIHCEGAQGEAWFSEGPMKGFPAITSHVPDGSKEEGSGKAWYLGIRPDKETLFRLFDRIVEDAAVHKVMSRILPGQLEITNRRNKEGLWYFLMNFSDETVVLSLDSKSMINPLTGRKAGPQISLSPLETAILLEKKLTR